MRKTIHFQGRGEDTLFSGQKTSILDYFVPESRLGEWPYLEDQLIQR